MTRSHDGDPTGVSAADLVSRVWAGVIGLEHFDPDDDFFALGGDSVSAALVALRVGKAANAHVPSRALFEYPTFRDFTAFVDRRRQSMAIVAPRADCTTHPLAPGQERLWLLNRLHPDRAVYTVPTIVELAGSLDRGALHDALLGLVARHEPLRTVIVDSGDGALCRVFEPGPVRIETESAADMDDARARATEFLRRPFALLDEPPIRIQVLQLSPARHWLLLAIHHIATDGESEKILLDELGRLYNAAVSGVPAALAPLPTTYGDVAAWRSGRAASLPADRREVQQTKLRGYQDRPLALEGLRPELADGLGARHTRWLGGRLAESVRACASRRRTTVFVALLSGFTDIVARWSGSDDVCVGYPVSVREPASARDLAGFFIDTCVIRVDLSGQPSFASVIDSVHSGVVQAAADSVPFDILAEAVAAERGDRAPLFRTWFNHLGAATRAPAMDGLTTAVLDIPMPPALFDLNVYVVEFDEDIRVDLVYDIAVCSDNAAKELLDQYIGLLAEAVADVEAPLRRHRRRASLTVALPDPGDPLETPASPTLARRLAEVVRLRGTSVALRDACGDASFIELRASVRELAEALRAAGVRPGNTVAVHGIRGSGLVTSMLAVWAAGARLLMLDPGYPTARLAGYLATGQARCLIVAGAPAPRLRTEALIRLEHGTPKVERVAASGASDTKRGVGYLAFTSGSTGEPVGVMGGLEPIEHFLQWYSAECELGPEDRFALLAGLSHDPLFRDVLLPLWNGATLCIPSPATFREPADLVSWLRDEHVTVANLTPPLARVLMAEGVRLPALRIVCLGGDVLTAADVTRLSEVAPGAVLLNGYGTTETPQLVSRRRLTAGQLPTLGASAPGSQLLVVDPDGELCGIGEAGSIVVRSRHLVAAVLADDADPRPRLDDPTPGVGRFASGDLGRYRTDGSVAYLGRADDTVNIRGFRAHPAETDRALATDPRVTVSVTVPWTGPDGPEFVSYVVGSDVVPTEIRARLAVLLPAHLIPTVIVPLDRLPLTENGKLDRAALPDPRSPEPPGRAARSPLAPDCSLESQLARVWSVVLGIEHIDVTDNFFDLGGTSLKMLRLHSAIRREVDDRMPLLALYENPSVRTLARSMSEPAVPAARTIHGRVSRADERSRRLAARQPQPQPPPRENRHTNKGDDHAS